MPNKQTKKERKTETGSLEEKKKKKKQSWDRTKRDK